MLSKQISLDVCGIAISFRMKLSQFRTGYADSRTGIKCGSKMRRDKILAEMQLTGIREVESALNRTVTLQWLEAERQKSPFIRGYL